MEFAGLSENGSAVIRGASKKLAQVSGQFDGRDEDN